MRYMLRVRTLANKDWHDHYSTLDELLVGIGKVAHDREAFYSYVTFSPTGKCMPADTSETVLTVYYDNEILCPASAGGNWPDWDEYNKKFHS